MMLLLAIVIVIVIIVIVIVIVVVMVMVMVMAMRAVLGEYRPEVLTVRTDTGIQANESCMVIHVMIQ